MAHENLKERTRAFALAALQTVGKLPSGRSVDVIARQLVRCATSVGANYRSACRAKSRADFIAKMKIVEEEADESAYWLQLLVDAGYLDATDANLLLREADEIVAIVVASIRTAQRNRNS